MQSRNTRQKEIILSALKELYHPTADEILSKVEEMDSSIGRATVFRLLSNMVAAGSLSKYYFDDKVVYDIFVDEHDHFICLKCGKIIDLPKSDIKNMPSDLKVVKSSISYYGYCDQCQKDKGDKHHE